MERCNLLARERGRVEGKELGAWKTRHIQKQTEKKKKGPVGPEKEAEEDKLESFFSSIYEFHNPVPAFVPAALPPRYAINFVPAASIPVNPAIVAPVSTSASAPVSVPSSPSTVYSVVSSVNFALPVSSSSRIVSPPSTDYTVISSANFDFPVSPSSCIGQTQ